MRNYPWKGKKPFIIVKIHRKNFQGYFFFCWRDEQSFHFLFLMNVCHTGTAGSQTLRKLNLRRNYYFSQFPSNSDWSAEVEMTGPVCSALVLIVEGERGLQFLLQLIAFWDSLTYREDFYHIFIFIIITPLSTKHFYQILMVTVLCSLLYLRVLYIDLITIKIWLWKITVDFSKYIYRWRCMQENQSYP